MKPKAMLATLTLVVAFAATAPSAYADKVTLSITPNAPGQAQYAGKVKSNRDRCTKGRTVQVYDLSGGGYLIGSARTEANGKYELLDWVPEPGQQVRVDVSSKKKCKGLHTIAEVPPNVVIQQR